MFLYFKKLIVFLNDLHNISYAAIFIFFKIIILFNVILDSLLEYLYFFIIKDIAFCRFTKLLKLF